MQGTRFATTATAVLFLVLAGCGPSDKDDEASAGIAAALGSGHGGSGHGGKPGKHEGFHHDHDFDKGGHGNCRGPEDHKVQVCHVTCKGGKVVLIEVDAHAVPAHLAHGDWLAVDGQCEQPSRDVIEPPAEDATESDGCQGKCEDAGQPPEDTGPPPVDEGPAVDVTPPPADAGPAEDAPPVCPEGQNCQGQT
jgi:hypothetical protein